MCSQVGDDKYKRILVSEAQHGRREMLPHGPKKKPNYTSYPPGLGSALPSWVAFDKHVSHLTLGEMVLKCYMY